MNSNSTASRRVLQVISLAALVLAFALAALSTPGPAGASTAATPCWKKLINDWYDGRIDHSYEVHCYREALSHLPQDLRSYSDAYDVISRALASATRGKKHTSDSAVIAPPSSGGGSSGGGSSGGTGSSGNGSGGGTGATGGTTGGSGPTGSGDAGGGSTTTDGGFLTAATDKLGSNRADSVPIPLLVLAGLALLLVAAGAAGLVARRLQGRRPRP